MSTGPWGLTLLISFKANLDYTQRRALCVSTSGLIARQVVFSYYSFYSFCESNPETTHHQNQTYGQVFTLIFVFGERLSWAELNQTGSLRSD